MVGKLRAVNPLYRGAIQRLRFAGKKFAYEEFQVDRFFGIGVSDFLEQFPYGNLHAQFLVDFADETLLETFASLAFAPGEFPKAAEVRLRVALRDEQLAGTKNQRGGNFNDE